MGVEWFSYTHSYFTGEASIHGLPTLDSDVIAVYNHSPVLVWLACGLLCMFAVCSIKALLEKRITPTYTRLPIPFTWDNVCAFWKGEWDSFVVIFRDVFWVAAVITGVFSVSVVGFVWLNVVIMSALVGVLFSPCIPVVVIFWILILW